MHRVKTNELQDTSKQTTLNGLVMWSEWRKIRLLKMAMEFNQRETEPQLGWDNSGWMKRGDMWAGETWTRVTDWKQWQDRIGWKLYTSWTLDVLCTTKTYFLQLVAWWTCVIANQ